MDIRIGPYSSAYRSCPSILSRPVYLVSLNAIGSENEIVSPDCHVRLSTTYLPGLPWAVIFPFTKTGISADAQEGVRTRMVDLTGSAKVNANPTSGLSGKLVFIAISSCWPACCQ